ncbi:MAG: DUF1573 domain-containing protein [Chloroflexota bacterium]
MKHTLLAICLLAVVYGSHARPAIFVNDSDRIDLGIVNPRVVDNRFTVYNRGDDTLEIISMAASCSCTSFNIDKRKIGPNDSATAGYKIDLREINGERVYHIYFNTNDSAHLKKDINIHAEVYRDLESVPKKLGGIFNMRFGDTATYKLELINSGENEIKITEAKISDPNLFTLISTVPENCTIPQHSSKALDFKIKANQRSATISKLILYTTSKTVPELEYTFIMETAR